MLSRVLSPHPLDPVLNGLVLTYSRFLNLWLQHLSPALHVFELHSIIISRFKQSSSEEQGASEAGSHSHMFRGSSPFAADLAGTGLIICTFPTGRFVLICLYGGHLFAFF